MPHPQSKRAKAAKAKRARERRGVSQEERREAEEHREERAEMRERSERKLRGQERTKRVRTAVFSTAAVVLVGLGLWWAFRPAPELEGVERPTNLGRGHITGASFADSAPTSGAHSAGSPGCGVLTTPLSLDVAVHGLEHGVVVLWYSADRPELGADLVSATDQWDSHVIISPSVSLDSPIVATAWNRRQSYDEAGAGLIDFVDTYRRRGPESVPCDR